MLLFNRIRRFLSGAEVAKAEQLGLFDAPVLVTGYTTKKGTVVAGHRSTRKKAVDKVETPPAQHPIDKAKVTTGSIVTWSRYNKAVTGRVTEGPDPGGMVRVTVTDSQNELVKIGQHLPQHVDNLTVVVANDQPPEHAQQGMDFEGAPLAAAEADEPAAAVVRPYAQFGAAYNATPAQRRADNAAALKILREKPNEELTDEDRRILARYSGNGGIGDSLNEYYTRQDVAEAMWSVVQRLGIPGGRGFEPSCGTGMFMHTAPAGFDVDGVELDPISARIASALHPAHDVVQAPLEAAANNGLLYDVVIGNPPFGPRGALVAQDKKDIPRAEQYFVDTALDKTAEGGLVAMVVPTGILDASSARRLRRAWCCKGQFLGAIRMPNTAFKHSQTEVVTDVVFWRRRAPDAAQALQTLNDEQLKTLGVLDEEFINGDYFSGRGANNVKGKLEEGWRAKAGMGEDITVTGSMDGVAAAVTAFEPEAEGAPVTMGQIQGLLAGDERAMARARRAALRPPYDVAKVGDTRVIDGVRYILQGHPPRWHRTDDVAGAPPEPEHVASARAIGQRLREFQGGAGGSSAIIQALEQHIEKYGIPRKSAEFRAAAERDPDLLRVMAAVRADGTFSDLLTGAQHQESGPTFEAAAEKLSEEGDGFTVAELVSAYPDTDTESALDQLYASNQFAVVLGGAAPRFVTMAQYLTGELWPKLDAVQAALAGAAPQEVKAKLALQAEKLEQTIAPKSLDDVELGLNYAWIPLDVVTAFFNRRQAEYLAEHPAAASWLKPWEISFDKGFYSVKGGGDWSSDLLDKYLNRTGVREEDWPKVHQVNEEFAAWLLSSEHRERVEDIYNRAYRGFVQPTFSKEPMEVPGLTKDMSVNDYHWPGLRWALARRKGICAADVGLGKTVRALMLAKLLKVHGHAKKPLIVVPKSVLANWASEIGTWFPGASVLVIGENYTKDKDGKLKARPDTAAERARKYHDLAQNHYDFVLMSQPTWNELDIDPITKGQYSDDEFWSQRGEALGNAGDKRRRDIKERFQQAMAKRDFDKRTDVIYFNDLGVDALIMDEAHCFPAGTLVDGRPIESLRPGDLVFSYDHATGRVERRPVSAVMARPVDRLLRLHFDDGRSVISTPEHPFYVQGSGYVMARHLTVSDMLVVKHTKNDNNDAVLPLQKEFPAIAGPDGEFAALAASAGVLLTRVLRRASRQNDDSSGESELGMQPLRQAIHVEQRSALEFAEDETGAAFLQPQLRGELEACATGVSGRIAFPSSQGEAEAPSSGAQLAPDAGSRREEPTGTDLSRIEQRESTSDSRGQRQAAAACAALIGGGALLAHGVCGTDQAQAGIGVSSALQIRHRQPGAENLHRGGWTNPRIPIGEGQGCEENSAIAGIRLARVEVLESAGDREFGGLCPGGLVYDLRVDGSHSYFAEGILVHNCFKNLFAAKNRFGESPKFLGGSGESGRAIDTNFKSRWLREQNGGNNVYFLTATPTKNSPLEVYSMLQHIAPEAFERMGIRNSEEFIDRFCEFSKDTFLDTSGAIGEALITSGFKNMDELREVMYRWMDRQTAKDVGLKMPVPEHIEHLIDMNEAQQKVYAELRALALESSKDTAGAHIFSIMDKMGKAALDLELLDPAYAKAGSPKYQAIAAEAAQRREDGGQIIFCEAVDSHERIKKHLVDAGFKPDEIGIINAQSAKTSLARQKISDDFNSGKLKVVIGNKTMEEGINLQKRTSDIHHADVPWEPAAIQQRNGRGLRQGNKLAGIRIHRYLSRGSFDGYRYQTMAAKRDWMDQLYGTAVRTENLAAQMKPSRDEMLIMLSADPEAERKKYQESKGAALAVHKAERRARAGAAFERFRQMHRSYAGLTNKETRTGEKLRRALDDAKTRLKADEYFGAKDALDAPDKVLVDPATGDAFRIGQGVAVTCSKQSPLNLPDGTHRLVVAGVDTAARTLLFRQYGNLGATFDATPAGIAGHAEHFAVDEATEHAEAAANELGNIKAAALKLSPGPARAEGIVQKVLDMATGASQDWHKTPGGRGRVWAMLADALREANIDDEQAQPLVDAAELNLALREHGLGADDIDDPAALRALPEAAVLANQDTILRHLNALHMAYRGKSPSTAVPMIGAGGDAVLHQTYRYRDALDKDRFMLPTSADQATASRAWKALQRSRRFSAKANSGRQQSGVDIRYGDSYETAPQNPMAQAGDKLFGAGWQAPARKELLRETAADAASKTDFRDRVTAWLPAAEARDYTSTLKWPHEALLDLARAAKEQGLLDHAAGREMAQTPYIFDNGKLSTSHGGFTVAAVLRAAALHAGYRELADELATAPQTPVVTRDYRFD